MTKNLEITIRSVDGSELIHIDADGIATFNMPLSEMQFELRNLINQIDNDQEAAYLNLLSCVIAEGRK